MSDAPQDPKKTHRFVLEIDGLEAASFEACKPLEIVKVTEVGPDAEVRAWMQTTFDTGPIVMRRAVLIPQSDEAREAHDRILRACITSPLEIVHAYIPHDDPEPPPLPPTGGGSGGETW